ncbi:MAG TPA: DUF397 domain-containing protein [Trebonia sp.]
MTKGRFIWVKSSYSGSQGGNCVEVAVSAQDRVLVRDTKDREGAILAFTPDLWREFATQLKAGRYGR